MLLNEKHKIPQDEQKKLYLWMSGRLQKVSKTMARIKYIVTERDKYSTYERFEKFRRRMNAAVEERLEKEQQILEKLDRGEKLSPEDYILKTQHHTNN